AALALMCASHNGEAVHVATVRRMLARIDAREAHLQCGCHVPYFYQWTGTAPPPGATFGPLFHNCSGKHAGFLAWCRLHDRPFDEYLDPDSPLQTRIARTVERFAPGSALPMGIDGCSAPNFAMPLSALAHAFGSIARRETPELAALAFAMTEHPDLVSGTGRFDLALARAGDGDWICKAGAEG